MFALPVLYWKVQDTEMRDEDYVDEVAAEKVQQLEETKA